MRREKLATLLYVTQCYGMQKAPHARQWKTLPGKRSRRQPSNNGTPQAPQSWDTALSFRLSRTVPCWSAGGSKMS